MQETRGRVEYIDWSKAIEVVKPHIVHIATPKCGGTGFSASATADGSVCAVATAAHVLSDSYSLKQPITVTHYASGETLVLGVMDRLICMEEAADTAALIFFEGRAALTTTAASFGSRRQVPQSRL